jgi:hypothetical protein
MGEIYEHTAQKEEPNELVQVVKLLAVIRRRCLVRT